MNTHKDFTTYKALKQEGTLDLEGDNSGEDSNDSYNSLI